MFKSVSVRRTVFSEALQMSSASDKKPSSLNHNATHRHKTSRQWLQKVWDHSATGR